MNTLKQVVEAKVEQAIAKGHGTATDAWERMKAQGSIMEDFLVPIGKAGRAHFVWGQDSSPERNHPVLMVASGPDGSELFAKAMHKNGAEQLGEKLGIPQIWLRDHILGDNWRKEAITNLLNSYARDNEQRTVLVRSVGDQVRGVLSDRYKRIDTVPVMTAFITQAYAMGAKLYDGSLTDLKAYMEVLKPEVVEVPIDGGQPVHIVFGAQINNSDFGKGSLEVRGFYLQGACLNGMVRRNVMREVHRGSKLYDLGDIASKETLELEIQATKSAIGDVVREVLGQTYIQDTVIMIHRAAGMEVNVQKEVKDLNNYGVYKGEIDEIEAILAAGRYEDGVACPPSAWKVAQGITAVARTKDDDRRRDLQFIAEDWLNKQLGDIEGQFEKAHELTEAAE